MSRVDQIIAYHQTPRPPGDGFTGTTDSDLRALAAEIDFLRDRLAATTDRLIRALAENADLKITTDA